MQEALNAQWIPFNARFLFIRSLFVRSIENFRETRAFIRVLLDYFEMY